MSYKKQSLNLNIYLLFSVIIISKYFAEAGFWPAFLQNVLNVSTNVPNFNRCTWGNQIPRVLVHWLWRCYLIPRFPHPPLIDKKIAVCDLNNRPQSLNPDTFNLARSLCRAITRQEYNMFVF